MHQANPWAYNILKSRRLVIHKII